ncbi:hypothetical protein JW835_16800 [bacterium]|nr:hypothetical protein [bacterium]
MKVISLILSLLVIFSILLTTGCIKEKNPVSPTNPIDMPYTMEIDPSDFESSNLTGNAYFRLTPGVTFIFEGKDEDGLEIRVDIIVEEGP